MDLYFSGNLVFEKKRAFLRSVMKCRLLSYPYMRKGVQEYYVGRKKQGVKILMDSGAYSVWNKGQHIDNAVYIQYILNTLENYDVVISLDQIPGKPGYRDQTLEERNEAATVSWKNYVQLVESGVPAEKAVVVFHQGESFRFLENMLENKCPRIGLSPTATRTTKEKCAWLNSVMPVVCDSDGFPKAKLHGFAVTSTRVMLNYPWDSVDSATWTLQAAVGGLNVPLYLAPHEYDFTRSRPLLFGIHKKRGHVRLKTPLEQERITAYFKENGFIKESLSEMEEDYHIRFCANAFFFDQLAQVCTKRERRWVRSCLQEDVGFDL